MLIHKNLNVVVTNVLVLQPKPVFLLSDLTWHPNNSQTAVRHNWFLLLLPELDTRLILCGDTARSELRFLLSLFRLKQETEGPALAFEPGVFLKLEESGLDTFLPDVAAVFEAEPCEKIVEILIQITPSSYHFR